MDNFERQTLMNIEAKLDSLIKSSENRLTENEVNIKNQQKGINDSVKKEVCNTTVKNIKIAVGFMYSVVLVAVSAVCYKFFGG